MSNFGKRLTELNCIRSTVIGSILCNWVVKLGSHMHFRIEFQQIGNTALSDVTQPPTSFAILKTMNIRSLVIAFNYWIMYNVSISYYSVRIVSEYQLSWKLMEKLVGWIGYLSVGIEIDIFPSTAKHWQSNRFPRRI